ncbi:adenylate/guanylate cyclase domain-containing protein [Pseudanabaena sp. FACHB-2040]|uniref:adenylate/guanylate cyclase domain-containing protein n=1 Tax=Pseudanabaena sp. FACHB-2040 TaxID=2692859 RepID=UPI001688FC12|nr:adenylate/guanylate cyclase domain-containing protein [Pseudanabaena sp. FACHB-2040]MBD2259733.1 HAMP domain-containing protein [Pseudanabaena sp. FACHB-2040]
MAQLPRPQGFNRLFYALRHPSLRLVFTVPMLIQLVSAVGLVGYLSFLNGQRAVQDLASQLRGELSARIEKELHGYFGDPHAINRINATSFAYGELDINEATSGENLLFQQMKIYPTIAFVYCGSARTGEFFGVLRSPDTGQLQLSYGNASNKFLRDYYSLDVRGSRQHFLYKADKRYDSRERPWFQAATMAEGPAWTDVYLAFTTGLPNVTASLPVYDRWGKELLGVCATDVVLPEEFRSFLTTLEIGKSGQAFVIDRSGHLISSSTDEPLMVVAEGKEPKFLKALNSTNPLVQQSTQFLQDRYWRLDNIQRPLQLNFKLNGERHFLEVLPFSDGYGLDWLIVVVVPESDFMARINANNRITAALCAGALAIAILVGIFLTRRVTEPILKLNAAVKEIANGRWDRRMDIKRTDEVGELAASFNSMALKLQESFQTLEAQKNAFARFFPPEYLKFFDKQSVTDIDLGDHVSKEMTVMFSDIRRFTSLAEKMAPDEAFDFINDYLQDISPEIRSHNGFVVKFLGDGVMAIFPDRVEDALDACIAQFQRIWAFNSARQALGDMPIDVGIGLHFGHLMVGMVGEHNRMQGDALSDTVNLAARLEGLTNLFGVSLIVSEHVLARVADCDRYQVRFLARTIVKGRTEPIAIYEVLDAEPETVRHRKLQTLNEFELGLKEYSSHNLSAAQACFQQVLTANPADAPAKLYLERINQTIAQDIPDHWDGVWSFSQKR